MSDNEMRPDRNDDSSDPITEDLLATARALDYPPHPVTWILRELIGRPRRLESFLNDLDETLVDCTNGTADIDDVTTLLAYWVSILKLEHVHA